jgi:hypothetical protein
MLMWRSRSGPFIRSLGIRNRGTMHQMVGVMAALYGGHCGLWGDYKPWCIKNNTVQQGNRLLRVHRSRHFSIAEVGEVQVADLLKLDCG